MKLVIRRLPPGLTQSEFTAILGPEWELGNGKVDWFSYAPGKVSQEYGVGLLLGDEDNDELTICVSPAKPSRPSRAYLHVMNDSIMPLGDAVRTLAWEDAKGTSSSSSLIGPPVLEPSIYKKVPSTKKRPDARQGTIDQDPEFMAFLEELASPAPAGGGNEDDAEEELNKTEVITTTPLVEYLKERKNRAKESSKKDKQSGKGKGTQRDNETSTEKRGRDPKSGKSEKGAKEKVRILTKKTTLEQATEAAVTAANQISSGNIQELPKSRRAGIAAAARILQRDLGLSPGNAHRRARQDVAKAESEAKAANKESGRADAERPQSAGSSAEAPPSQSSKSRPTTPPTQQSARPAGRKGRGAKTTDKKAGDDKSRSGPQSAATKPPVILKKGSEPEGRKTGDDAPTSDQAPPSRQAAQSQNGPKETQKKSISAQNKPASISAGAIRGFVKHASSSQGVTESSLRQALEKFGSITSIELDKRKGFAFVDFAEHEGLVKAADASPIAVGAAAVEVLERKDKKLANTGASGQAGSGGGDKSLNRGRRSKGVSGGGGGGKSATAAKAQRAAQTTGSNDGAG